MNPDIRSIIIYEDTQVIVCHKPAGLPVQSSRIGVPDLVSILKNHLSASLETRPEDRTSRKPAKKEPYLAVIHRLDQPVEGLLVFAKTPAAAKDLNRQLTSAGFGKYYLALAKGIPEPPEGDLQDYLIKDGRANASRVCSAGTPGAKAARLHYRVLEPREGSALLEIRLDTGRHHQIRVQMAHLGHPLIGDRKYGDPGTGPRVLKLCAFRLEFLHPEDGRPMEFELSSLPW